MIDPTLLKQIVFETIPESLYQQLEPLLEEVSSRYVEAKTMICQLEELKYWDREDRSDRFKEIQAEFHKHNEPEWPAFARARWPEIDKYFNLETATDKSKPSSLDHPQPKPANPFEDIECDLPF